jgi:IS4 transposase
MALKVLRFGRVKVAVDCTEEPYWGKNGMYNTRAKIHEKSDESWQYVNLAIVQPRFIPLMSLPYRQIDDLDTLVIDLLEYLRTLPLKVELVLFDRGFYHWKLIDYLSNLRGKRPCPYLIFVPKNDAMKKYIKQTKGRLGVFMHEGIHSKKKTTWKPRTKIVICKGIGKNKNGKQLDWCFATNQKASLNLVRIYRKRWNIETGFRIQDETTIKSKSSHPLIRYFYHLISMIIILMWRIHNHVHGHMVFKRFLKLVEIKFEKLALKPPDWTNCR